jgi:hypothetical protein
MFVDTASVLRYIEVLVGFRLGDNPEPSAEGQKVHQRIRLELTRLELIRLELIRSGRSETYSDLLSEQARRGSDH